jgi:hypothetical protein
MGSYKGENKVKRDSDRLEPLIEPAVKVLKGLFTGVNIEDNDISTARIAASSLATWSRLKQAERAQEAIYFSMARELASDKDQLAQYIKATLPDVPIARVLEVRHLSELDSSKEQS